MQTQMAAIIAISTNMIVSTASIQKTAEPTSGCHGEIIRLGIE